MTTNLEFARKNTVYRVRTGSQLFGTQISATPDNDEMGIFVETPEQIFNVDPTHTRMTSVSNRTAGHDPQGQSLKSQAGDTDLQLYSLSHFMRETAKGNPNTITMLFVPQSLTLTCTPDGVGVSLRAHAHRFLSKGLGIRYLKYLDNQRQLYLFDEQHSSKTPQRPELIAEYGFDTKGAYHALRVVMQGIEMMTTRRLKLPMDDTPREYLLAVRRGEFTKEVVLKHMSVLERHLQTCIDQSQLSDHPDYDLLTRWSQRLHEQYWDYLQGCA